MKLGRRSKHSTAGRATPSKIAKKPGKSGSPELLPVPRIPERDNTPEDLAALLEANTYFRNTKWPPPYDATRHTIHTGDARDLGWIEKESVHLIVTSPPYWNLKEYERGEPSQLGDVREYEKFLCELDKVWSECARVLVGGGRVCCVVGDVCVPRRKGGKHYVAPLHADIQVRTRRYGLDCLTPILWQKIANGCNEAQGNGAGFYGKPYQPGSIIKNDVEYVLFLRKGGQYRSPSPLQKALSMLNREEMQTWLRSSWSDISGASTRDGHPAPFPISIAERLIKLFSFAGDTVLDPFAGTGSTTIAAMMTGRNSISNEIEQEYVNIAKKKINALLKKKSGCWCSRAEVQYE